MKDDFFNFLVATDQVDEFLGYELPWEIKEQIKEIAINYKTEKRRSTRRIKKN